MEQTILEAQKREVFGRKCRGARMEGLVPSVMYGQGNNLNLFVTQRDFLKLYNNITKSTIINLKLGKDKYDVIVKDYEIDHMKNRFIHIDFYELKKGKTVHMKLPISFTGNSVGIREGGIMEKHLVELDIECLPKDIIPTLEIDITNLKIGDTIHVSDIDLTDKNIKVLSHPEEAVVHIAGKVAEEMPMDEGEESILGMEDTLAAEEPSEDEEE